MTKITVQDKEITIIKQNNEDYISLTDMIKIKTGEGGLIEKWISNKNTIEFLGFWEELNNEKFNYPEFGVIKSEAGTNRFIMSVKQWVSKTNAIGITAKAGKYGGTFAHKDIAFEFGTWLSPMFKLLLIKEFQRLKDDEARRLNTGWDVRRLISKANYQIQTDAVAKNIIVKSGLAKDKEWLVYAEEADILNYVVFGITAKQWRDSNPKLAAQKLNIRDYADVHDLIILSNLESINGEMIHQGIGKESRYKTLVNIYNSQLSVLKNSKAIETLNAPSPNLKPENKTLADFDKHLTKISTSSPRKRKKK